MDTEWKIHPEFNNYKFSNYGDIQKITPNKNIKGSIKQEGYKCTNLLNNDNKKTYILIHRIIAELFIENPNSYSYIRHLDGNKINNYFKNLEYISQKTSIVSYDEIINEEWIDITIDTNFQVSNKGRVRNKNMNSLMKQRINPDGYNVISIGLKKCVLVHRLVAIAFIHNPNNYPSVDHIDRTKNNNNLENLRWSTPKKQCENRIFSKGDFILKVQRINKDNGNVIETYNSIDDAVEYIYSNKLSTTKNKKSIKSLLHGRLGGKYKTGYNYIWKYVNMNTYNLKNEEWKSVQEIIPIANDYKISNYGRVKNTKGVLVNGTNNGGYIYIYIGIKKKEKLHRLVAGLFIPNPEKKRCVNHIDGDPFNNTLENLEWNTHAENTQHAMNSGLNSCCKQVEVIKLDTKNVSTYLNIKLACKKLNLKYDKVQKKLKKECKYIDEQYNIIYKNF